VAGTWTALCFAATTLAAQQPAPLAPGELAAWQEDLQVLATELPKRHKNAFAHLTRAQWDSAVGVLDSRLPRLRRHEVIVELMRLVALVKDGHTFLAPDFEDRIGFHQLPIRLYDFADGLYIIAADGRHADLAGARVVSLGRATAPDALAAVTAIVSHESPGWARFRGAAFLAMPEVVAGLGLSDDPARTTLVVERNGQQRTVTLEAAGPAAAPGPPGRQEPAGWVDMRQATPGKDPLWLERPEAPFWFTILPDRTLYIGYREVQFFAAGETNEQFFRRAFAAGDSAAVERVVLDIRANGGGNNFLNRFLVRELIRRPALDRTDRLMVLIGRATFSAAQNLVNELDYYTSATFVGEPTGNAPNQYGDARRLELPRSRLRVFVSSLYWQGHVAADARPAFTPDVFVEMTAADYRARRDPLLAAALRWATGPTLAQRLSPDAARGDTAAVQRLMAVYRAHPENRFRDVEDDVNRAGYDLLGTGQVEAAVTVFRVNATLFAASANVHDSLGEALERAGRRDEAIGSFRRALTLNPGLGSSRDALRRLGALP